MLQRIRDNSSGPIAYVIVGLIALVFSVWGLGSYFTPSANPVVAEVGDATITKYQLRRAYNQSYRRLQKLMGERFDADQFNRDQFQRNVLRSLIQKRLLRQYAQDAGYRVTDAAVLKALRTDPRFQVNESFSTERYHAVLSRAGITTASFEGQIRNRKQVTQLRRGILTTAVVSDRAVRLAYALAHQERRVAYLAFQPETFVDQVEITDSETKAYYNKHGDQFMREQRVKLAYVELEQDEMKIAAEPDQKALKQLYKQVKDQRFKTPERRKARHILIQVDQDTSAAKARQLIQALADKLEQTDVSFAELARKVSDDQATADKGGQLGWVSRGTIVPGFEEALFKLKEGEISNPVKTEFGWHLIKLEKIDDAEYKPFDDPQVQSRLKALYRQRAREDRYQKMAQRLDKLAFQTGASLQPISDKLGLEIQKTGWVTRSGGKGIASHEAVVTAAFSPAVFKDRLNSTPIQLAPQRQVVLRVIAKQPAQQRPLDSVRDQIRAILVQRAAARIAENKAEKALQDLRGGKSLKTVAENRPAELVTVGWIGRDSGALPAALRQAAFALPKPTGQESTAYGKASTADGTVAVVRLSAVRTPDAKGSNSMQRIRRMLRNRIAGTEYRSLRRSLRHEYEVVIYQDRL